MIFHSRERARDPTIRPALHSLASAAMPSRSAAKPRLTALCLGIALTSWGGNVRAQEVFGTANAEERAPATNAHVRSRDPSDWDPAEPVPAGYHVEAHMRHNVVLR